MGELEEWNVRVAARWAPTEDFSLLFAYDKADGEGGLRPYYTLIDEVPSGLLYLTGARNSDTASDHFDNNGGFYIDPVTGAVVDRSVVTNDADGWAVTADWAMNDTLSWKLIYSDRSSDYESGLDDDSLGSIANPARDDVTGELLFPGTENGTVFSYPETGYADQQSAELQLFGDFGGWDFVAGLYQFEEEGGNRQDPNFFLGGPGVFINQQETDSWALYGNVGFDLTDALRLSVGARYTEDEKHAYTAPVLGVIEAESSRDWDEVTGEVSLAWDMSDRLNLYGTVQTGYQSGQYPARAYCLFGDPDCYVAGENVTAINYEVGLKGQPFDTLSMAAAVFYTDYSDLPYQVSNSTGTGFNTVNIIVDQTSQGFEWESTWAPGDNFLLHATLGFIDVDVDHPNPNVVAPLTPDLTWSLSPEYTWPFNGGGSMTFRADWSFRDDMYGEPSKDPARMTGIESRDLLNFDIAYHSPGDRWTLGVYGRNATDEKYANAKLLPTDYLLVIMNNDLSEFGVRFLYNFDGT